MKSDSEQETENEFFNYPMIIVNIGIRPFFDALKDAGVEVYQVDWSIPAGGDQEMLRVLDLLLE